MPFQSIIQAFGCHESTANTTISTNNHMIINQLHKTRIYPALYVNFTFLIYIIYYE